MTAGPWLRSTRGLPLLLTTGCLSFDPQLYNPEKVDQYSLSGNVIPGASVELVTFPSEDLTLYGAWARQPDPAQVVVFFHGDDGNIDTHWRRVEQYWSWGYDVLTFDYRGYGRSEGEPDLAGLEADGLAAVRYAAELREQGTGALASIGLGLGGAVAIRTARSEPPLALITEDTFANLDFLLDESAAGLNLADGWFFNEDWDNVQALTEVIGVPTMIVHARDDTYIPVANADLLYAAAPDPRDRWRVPGADHAESNSVAPAEYQTRLTGWVDQASAQLNDDAGDGQSASIQP